MIVKTPNIVNTPGDYDIISHKNIKKTIYDTDKQASKFRGYCNKLG